MLSSSNALKKLGFSVGPSSTKIAFTLPDSLKNAIPSLLRYKIKPINDGNIELNTLMNEYRKLCLLKTPDIEITVKQYKLAIVDAIYQHLQALSNTPTKKVDMVDDEPIWKSFWKFSLFIIVSVIGFVEAGLWSFFGAKELLMDIFPTIQPTTMLIGSGLVTIIDLVLYIGFEVGMVKDLFGISPTLFSSKTYELDEKEISLVKKINKLIFNACVIQKLSQTAYNQFSNAVLTLNDTIEKMRPSYNHFEESSIKWVVRSVFISLAALLLVVNSYFSTVSLLTIVAPTLLNTAHAAAIFGLITLGNFAGFLSMRGGGVTDVFNPSLEQFTRTKEKLSKFTPCTLKNFSHLYSNTSNNSPPTNDPVSFSLYKKEHSASDRKKSVNTKHTDTNPSHFNQYRR